MAQPGVQELLQQVAQLAKELTDFLGVDPDQHGMLRGTVQMAYAEAQGCGIAKAGAVPLSGSLQSTADLAARAQTTLFTRPQITGIFNHFESMRGAANGIATRLADMETKLAEVGKASPEAARVARQGYQQLMGTAAQRVQLAADVERELVEIANSGNANRLAGQVITETGRDAQFLAENQLAQRGLNLMPNALAQGRVMLQRIATLPINADEAKDMLKDIAVKGAAGMTAAYNAVRGAGTAARAWAQVAFETTGRFLVAFGAKLVFVALIPKKTLESLGKPPGYDDQGT
jgi:hypothetical protein